MSLRSVDYEKVRKFYDAGYIDRVVAEKAGCYCLSVTKWRHKNNLPPNGIRWLKSEKIVNEWKPNRPLKIREYYDSNLQHIVNVYEARFTGPCQLGGV